jgi:hypothetical protein
MALLVYSEKCKWSQDILSYIKTQPALIEVVRFWNVNTQGVPSNKITRVPTLVTNDGKMCVGNEVKAWLESMIPCDFECWDSGGSCSNLDGTDAPGFFEIDRYGESLQPRLTPEIEARIGGDVQDAYQKAGQRT